MGTMIRNRWTTIMGVLAGVMSYLVTVGPDRLPTSRQEWGYFLVSALLAGLGISAKDATTGSRPGAQS
jgi:hypothetical protein